MMKKNFTYLNDIETYSLLSFSSLISLSFISVVLLLLLLSPPALNVSLVECLSTYSFAIFRVSSPSVIDSSWSVVLTNNIIVFVVFVRTQQPQKKGKRGKKREEKKRNY